MKPAATILTTSLFLMSILPVCKTESFQPLHRSNFDNTTHEKFDAASIPAQSGNHEAVYDYIDAHLEEHLENI